MATVPVHMFHPEVAGTPVGFVRFYRVCVTPAPRIAPALVREDVTNQMVHAARPQKGVLRRRAPRLALVMVQMGIAAGTPGGHSWAARAVPFVAFSFAIPVPGKLPGCHCGCSSALAFPRIGGLPPDLILL